MMTLSGMPQVSEQLVPPETVQQQAQGSVSAFRVVRMWEVLEGG